MGVLTLLKKIGQVIVKGAAVEAGFAPLVAPLLGSKASAAVGTVTNDLTAAAQVVTQVEAIGQTTGLTGAQKLAAAIPLITNIINTSELISGKNVANRQLFAQGCSEITQGVVDLLNSLDQNNVKTS